MINYRSIMSQNMDDIKDYYTTDDSDSAMTENVENLRRNKKKRFSEDQIRSLERIFENETTRLEPRKKVQLARELGLHPRQIAIWFQNRRARWKSKQMERDFGKLRADYEALQLSFEALKQEKQALLKQLHKLSSSLEKQTETQTVQDPGSASTSEHCDSENPHRKTEPREMAFTREFTLFSETDDQYGKIIDENNVAAIDGNEYNCFDPSGITDGLDGSCGTVDQSAPWWELWS